MGKPEALSLQTKSGQSIYPVFGFLVFVVSRKLSKGKHYRIQTGEGKVRASAFTGVSLFFFFKSARNRLEFFRVNAGFQNLGIGLQGKKTTSLTRDDQEGLGKRQIIWGTQPLVFERNTNTL